MNRKCYARLGVLAAALLTALLMNAPATFAQGFKQSNFDQTIRRAASRLSSFARTEGELNDVAIDFNSLKREQVCGLFGQLVHYSFLVKVGPGEHDVIRLHRVVREGKTSHPFRPRPAIFMVHGDLWGFEGAFFSSANASSVPCDQSIAAYLANQEVDVWGIDLRWAAVPAGTPNPTFLRGQGTDTNIHDIGIGMAVARAVREAEGRGRDKLNLLGWSSGAINIYAFANDETRFPEARRHTKGLIPVDMALKFSPQDEDVRRSACQAAIAAQAQYDQGPGYNTGDLSQALGRLALTDPNGPAPFPGFTNREFALFVGAQTYAFVMGIPFYHFTGGTFDAAGKPNGLSYTRPEYLFEFFQMAAPFQSTKASVELQQLWCNETDVPWDDHLKEITVPVLYVGAEGGFGSYGLHTLTLLGSSDVMTRIVSFAPRPVDFGHADLFLADNARAEVWTVIYEWLRAR